MSSGEETRTPDLRVMNPPPDSPNRGPNNELRSPGSPGAHHLPTDTRQSDPELAALVDAWPTLPEALRAGIVAMVRAASVGDR